MKSIRNNLRRSASKCSILMWPKHLILPIAIVLFISSCSDANGIETNHYSVEPPILTVTGEACPIFETELFTTNEKRIFNECDLAVNARLFDGRLVRVRSQYAFMIHGSYLTGTPCSGISNSIHEAVSVGISSKKDFDYIDRLGVVPVDFVGVGRFDLVTPSRRSDTIYDNTPYRFKLMCLEAASEPPNIRYRF